MFGLIQGLMLPNASHHKGFRRILSNKLTVAEGKLLTKGSITPNIIVMEKVRVDKSAQESILSGHLWVFSNQVVERPTAIPPGEIVQVVGPREKRLGTGYINTGSLIMVRLLSREAVEVDASFFSDRIEAALRLRQGLGWSSLRVVNSESDLLPGLVVDRYAGCAVIQVLTCGIEKQLDNVIAAVRRTLSPDVIVLRNDNPYSLEEGLSQYPRVVEGQLDGPVMIEEGGFHFSVQVMAGQKTGFYLDQRENRACLRGLVEGRTVLDLFCYSGAFGVYALSFGARSVTFVDASAAALDSARENVALNGLDRSSFVRADAFDFLKAEGDQYDVIICDPPSFVKSKKKLKEGERGYIDLHKKALRRLNDGGLMVTFSCSHHMRRSRFRDMARIAAYGHADLYLLRELYQAADHPVLLAIPETEYLKGMVLRVKKRS